MSLYVSFNFLNLPIICLISPLGLLTPYLVAARPRFFVKKINIGMAMLVLQFALILLFFSMFFFFLNV